MLEGETLADSPALLCPVVLTRPQCRDPSAILSSIILLPCFTFPGAVCVMIAIDEVHYRRVSVTPPDLHSAVTLRATILDDEVVEDSSWHFSIGLISCSRYKNQELDPALPRSKDSCLHMTCWHGHIDATERPGRQH